MGSISNLLVAKVLKVIALDLPISTFSFTVYCSLVKTVVCDSHRLKLGIDAITYLHKIPLLIYKTYERPNKIKIVYHSTLQNTLYLCITKGIQ